MKKRFLFLLPLLLSSCQVITPGKETTTSNQDSVLSGTTQNQETTNENSETNSTQETTDDDSTIIPENKKESETFYQLLVYSFADGNGDGIGDFKGIVDKLDYLSSLGITGLWLSPIHPSASYHSYDVIDYEKVKSVYEVSVNNVTYNLDYLISKAHEKGIKIVLDMVLNHTSNQHDWYKNHRDYYQSENYFGYDMPELDYDKSVVRENIKRICSNYLTKGVDGFRLDAAYWIYNSGADRDSKNFSWWNEFVSSMKQKKEDVYIIGEILDDNRQLCASYNQAGFDTFDFNKADLISSVILDKKANLWSEHLEDYQKQIRSYRSDAIEGNVLSNHDIGRFNASFSSKEEIIFANTLNILSPGTSYLYYGDELGLKGTCPNGYQDMAYRTPMPFESEMTSSQAYFEGFKGDGKSTSTTFSNLSAEEDSKKNDSIYFYTKQAIAIKGSDSTFYQGKVKSISSPISSLGAYSVSLDKTYTIVMNASSQSSEATLSKDANLLYEISPIGKVEASGKKLTLPSYSFAILENDGIEIKEATGENNTLPTPLSDESVVTQEKQGSITVHYYNENEWNDVYVYSWVNNNQYFSSWPGKKIEKNGYYYSFTLNQGAINLIFNNGSGKQTKDLYRNNPGEYYYYCEHWYASDPLI